MKKLLAVILILILCTTAHAAWKVPDGWEVKTGKRLVAGRTEMARPTLVKAPNGNIYGKNIFLNGQAQALGWKPIRQQGYDSENYVATPRETETATEVVRDWINTQPKMSVNARKKLFGLWLRSYGFDLLKRIDTVLSEYIELDPTNPKRAEWAQYRTGLKAAYTTIRAEVLAINNYNDLIDYIKCEPDPLVDGWRKHMPAQPDPE